jgi:hypothetical protein
MPKSTKLINLKDLQHQRTAVSKSLECGLKSECD